MADDQKTSPLVYNPATDPDMYDPNADADMIDPNAKKPPAAAKSPDEQAREAEAEAQARGESPMGDMGSQRPNVQPGIPDHDRIMSFGYSPDVMEKSKLLHLAREHFGSGFDWMISPKTSPDDTWSRFYNWSPAGGIEQGMGNTAMWGAQFLAHLGSKIGALTPEDSAYLDMLAKLHQEVYSQNTLGGQPQSTPSKLGMYSAPSLLIPGGSGPTGWLARGATGAAVGSMQPVTNTDPNDPDSYWKQAGINAGSGAIIGVFGEPIIKGLFKGGTAISWRLWNAFRDTPLPEDVARSMQQTIETRMRTGNWGNISDIQAAAQSGGPTASNAVQVLNRLASADASGVPAHITQAAIDLEDFRTQAIANQLYGNMRQVAQNYPASPALGTLRTMRSALNELNNVNIDEKKPVIDIIEGWRDRLLEWDKNANNGKGQYVPRNLDFDQLQNFLSDVQERIRDAHDKQGANFIASRATAYLSKVRDALRGDAEDYLTSNNANDLRQAWDQARSYYEGYRVPFTDPDISKAGAATKVDQILNMFDRKGKDQAASLFNSLGPRGQDAVRAQLLGKIIANGTAPEFKQITPGSFPVSNTFVSPQGMLTALDRYGDAVNTFFSSKSDQAAIGGLENILRHAAIAERYRAVPAGLAGAAIGGAAKMVGFPWEYEAAGFGVGGTAVRIGLTTRAGRKILYNALATKPGTPAMAALVKQLNDLGATLGSAASRLGPAAGAQSTQGPIVVKPWDPNFTPQFAGGGPVVEERMRRNTLESLRS